MNHEEGKVVVEVGRGRPGRIDDHPRHRPNAKRRDTLVKAGHERECGGLTAGDTMCSGDYDVPGGTVDHSGGTEVGAECPVGVEHEERTDRCGSLRGRG